MSNGARIIGLGEWLQTPAGRYLLDWEQQHVDVAVADLFGFHALQLGLPQLDALRANRMPHRWLGLDHAATTDPMPVASGADARLASGCVSGCVSVLCDFDALPFDSQSLDLVVLPHALELARDPHLTLREVERVLRPEGRVVILGLNPASLWGMRQRLGRLTRGAGSAQAGSLFLPNAGEFIAYRRLRDWLRLLSFEVEAGRFGCFRPPASSAKWLGRFEWMERVGDGWWPVFGAVYSLTAVKRVRGMRLVGLARAQRQSGKATAPAVAAQQQTHKSE